MLAAAVVSSHRMHCLNARNRTGTAEMNMKEIKRGDPIRTSKHKNRKQGCRRRGMDRKLLCR